ncbi:hypothetical protein Scep_004158 [Stephania cephalantha]|uniref:Uncharacterized protein n=1 Tax=Stephania cephalantha TaxID=152367 RepID=A0AAP0PX12_9MAGN
MVKISQALLSSQHHQTPHLVEETPLESDASTRGSPDEMQRQVIDPSSPKEE